MVSNKFDNLENDEYVASILKSEAKARTERYNIVGIEAFLPKRAIGAPPKPNTRFLRNIVREADSHNAALLTKEAEEASGRLKELKEKERRKRRKEGLRLQSEDEIEEKRIESRRRHRKETVNSSSSSLKHRKDRKDYRDDSKSTRRRGRPRSLESNSPHKSSWSRSRSRSRSHSRTYSRDRGDRKRRKNRSGSRHRRWQNSHSSERRKDRSRYYRGHSRSRSRSSSPNRDRKSRRRSEKKDGGMSRNTSLSRGKPKQARSANTPQESNPRIEDAEESNYSSDPLDEIIGPIPPPQLPLVPRVKGRGTITTSFGTSAMDARFNNANYDPSADIAEPEDGSHRTGIGDGDWDQALEAYRDRQKWKAQGAERLRSAGFTEELIKQWESNNTKNEENIKWAEKGKVREWDRGKTIEEETGEVILKAPW